MITQNKFTSAFHTKELRKVGYATVEEQGFQIHELLNLIPGEIWFKKTFIDWKKKTRFIPMIQTFHGMWLYDLEVYSKRDHSDQGVSKEQLVDLLADLILYVHKNKVKPPRKNKKS